MSMAGIEAQDQTGDRDLGEWNNVSRLTLRYLVMISYEVAHCPR